jgi:hypothetical protein
MLLLVSHAIKCASFRHREPRRKLGNNGVTGARSAALLSPSGDRRPIRYGRDRFVSPVRAEALQLSLL